MILLVLGVVLIVGSALAIRFTDLARVLKEYEPSHWERLGKPSGFGFADLGRSIGLLFWLLDGQYRNLSHAEVIRVAEKSRKRALWVKYLALLGVATVLLGLVTLALPRPSIG